MTPSKPLTISECAAKTLWAAWNSHDSFRLRSALAQTGAVATGALPPFEQERFEMLQEIAGRMRQWAEDPRGANPLNDELDASIGLLRHLAGAPEMARAMAAPQFEMRVFVRH